MTVREYTYGDFIEEGTHEFVMNVEEGYRYGQALFNVLLTRRPDLAERVRGTELDPFYEDTLSKDCVIGRFFVWVSDNW